MATMRLDSATTPPLTVVYDANGNTLSDAQGRSFTWDFENRLVQAMVSGQNGGTTTFKYDPFGRRIQKSGPLGTTNYLYDGANLLADLDPSGSVLSRYAQSKSLDEPLSELRSGMTSYYETDGVGSITSLMNSSATIVDSYTYDAFGNLSASTGSITNPFRYTGRESDPETGLYYYRARYYDPATGRFTSEDPIWPAGDLNQFGYAKAGPINWIDPLGLKTYVIILYRNEDMSDIIGEHAALHIDNGGHPIIFDPGADTQPIGGGEHPLMTSLTYQT
jgi:RHS repeat-associated protein